MIYERQLKADILKYLDDPEAIIILGSRQVGKTTLLRLLMEAIQAPEKVFYLDLEDPRNLDVMEQGLDSLIEFLTQKGASFKVKNYIFLDEIHYMRSPSWPRIFPKIPLRK